MDYLHPEVGVETTDATLFGRNYFNRPSAPETEDMEEAEERARVLAEAAALKKSAADWLHPEVGVTATAGECFGRNYFNRPSAPETEDDEFADERMEILEEAAALKKLAVDYLHPEVGVKATDATVFGRNYFNRPSAPETEDVEEAEERARVLAEAAALKKSAADWLHPEVGVTATAGECFGRNYVNRPSAPETEDDEFADERAEILEEAAALKRLAMDYLHPEVGVKATDATVFGRNYFNCPSAPETEDMEEAEERARILAEAAALKKSAVDYLHPEIGVKTTDATIFGRNYFNRYSAPETEDEEDAEERARILAEAAALKKSAVDYLHPEVGVTATAGECFGRNYFNRPSAPETEDVEEADERARVLAEASALKQSAVDYLHPEVGVTVTDPTVFGRNYFNRYSAPETELPKKASEESPAESQDVAAVKNLAAAVKGANLPNTKSAKLSSLDSVTGAKKSASTVNLFGLSEEVM
jgi:xylose isomerase